MIARITAAIERLRKPSNPVAEAQQRLAEIVEANRNSYEVRRYRERRAAALRGRA